MSRWACPCRWRRSGGSPPCRPRSAPVRTGTAGQCPAAPAAGGSGTVASISGELSSARWSGPGGGSAAEMAPIAPRTSLPSMRKSKFDALLRTDRDRRLGGRPVSPGTAASPGAMPRLPRRCQPRSTATTRKNWRVGLGGVAAGGQRWGARGASMQRAARCHPPQQRGAERPRPRRRGRWHARGARWRRGRRGPTPARRVRTSRPGRSPRARRPFAASGRRRHAG